MFTFSNDHFYTIPRKLQCPITDELFLEKACMLPMWSLGLTGARGHHVCDPDLPCPYFSLHTMQYDSVSFFFLNNLKYIWIHPSHLGGRVGRGSYQDFSFQLGSVDWGFVFLGAVLQGGSRTVGLGGTYQVRRRLSNVSRGRQIKKKVEPE